MSKISNKLNYSNSFRGSFFIRTVYTRIYNTHKAGKLHAQITRKMTKINRPARKIGTIYLVFEMLRDFGLPPLNFNTQMCAVHMAVCITDARIRPCVEASCCDNGNDTAAGADKQEDASYMTTATNPPTSHQLSEVIH